MNIAQVAPFVIDLLGNLKTAWKTDVPVSLQAPHNEPAASDAIRNLQALLNKFVVPSPDLKVDGWLGPKTEKAINDGIAMLRTLGVG
jgi:hypothetical protein